MTEPYAMSGQLNLQQRYIFKHTHARTHVWTHTCTHYKYIYIWILKWRKPVQRKTQFHLFGKAVPAEHQHLSLVNQGVQTSFSLICWKGGGGGGIFSFPLNSYVWNNRIPNTLSGLTRKHVAQGTKKRDIKKNYPFNYEKQNTSTKLHFKRREY